MAATRPRARRQPPAAAHPARRRGRAPAACAPGADCRPEAACTLEASEAHVRAFHALAHRGRLRVFLHLVQSGRPVAVQELLAVVRIPAPTLSHHLDRLERSGLIARQRQERFILSTVQRATVIELVRLLTACC